MPRQPRFCPSGLCYHVLNRGVARLALFENAGDYEAFTAVLVEAIRRESLPILAYCLMPNHWHFVVRPFRDDQVSNFFRWLTHTHTMRWHASHQTMGTGHLYQGRFKAFPVQEETHLTAVIRYVERNPVRANLCQLAEQWKYGSAWHRVNKTLFSTHMLGAWPIPMPSRWLDHVNQSQTAPELDAIRTSVTRGSPLGREAWISQAATRLNIGHTIRPRGRPSRK